jgi:hypothetical protein
MQRNLSLLLNGVALRGHSGGIKVEATFTEGEPELHENVVQAHGGRCVRVGRNI